MGDLVSATERGLLRVDRKITSFLGAHSVVKVDGATVMSCFFLMVALHCTFREWLDSIHVHREAVSTNI